MGTGCIHTASDFNNILLIIEQYRGVGEKARPTYPSRIGSGIGDC